LSYHSNILQTSVLTSFATSTQAFMLLSGFRLLECKYSHCRCHCRWTSCYCLGLGV